MNKLKYRLTRKKLTRMHPDGPTQGTVIVKGEVFVPTDSELRDFGDRLEKVATEPPAIPAQPVPSQEQPETVEAPLPAEASQPEDPVGAATGALIKDHVASMNVDEVKSFVLDKKGDPQSILEAEKLGHKRITLVRWLESHMLEVS